MVCGDEVTIYGPAQGAANTLADYFITHPGKEGEAMHRQPTGEDSSRQTRESNSSKKRGRSIASNGYVLVRVGIDHHLSDVRGYAYEHRVIAEAKIGRRLRPGEQVHHINGIKTDNRPENLEVCASHAEHFVRHRRKDSRRRKPRESNPIIECACGCGEAFSKFDESGRPRLFISGHNPSSRPTIDAILLVLESGPKHRLVIAAESGIGLQATFVALSKMHRQGLIYRTSRGVYKKGDC